MTLFATAPPAAEPVTLGEAKAHLRIDADDEDALIGALISTAREHVERETGLVMLSCGFRLCLDAWPDDGVVRIPCGPVRTIEAVTIYDGEGEAQAVPLAGHLLDGEARPVRLWLAAPPRPGRMLNGIEIDFVAGFGESGTDVPDTLKRAMLMHVAAMFSVRGVVSPEAMPAAIPPGYERLIAPFCRRGL